MPMTIASGWTDLFSLSAELAPAASRLRGDWVELYGFLKNATGSAYFGSPPLATLAASCRPPADTSALMLCGDNAIASSTMAVDTDGTLNPNIGGSGLANTHSIGFNGSRFRIV